jgi:hypothetical protein
MMVVCGVGVVGIIVETVLWAIGIIDTVLLVGYYFDVVEIFLEMAVCIIGSLDAVLSLDFDAIATWFALETHFGNNGCDAVCVLRCYPSANCSSGGVVCHGNHGCHATRGS